jgi:hypothetical protein
MQLDLTALGHAFQPCHGKMLSVFCVGLAQKDAQQLRDQGYAVMDLDALEQKGTLFHAEVGGRFMTWLRRDAPDRVRTKLVDDISGKVKASPCDPGSCPAA